MGCSKAGANWKGDSLDESSGKCQSGVHSVSKVNGECQKWLLPASDQIGGRRVEEGERKMVPTSTSDSGESSNRSLSLQHML